LKPRDQNARYMSPEEYGRLKQNIATDGCLTSAILVCQNADGSLEILSGHHRCSAAIDAGIFDADVIVITTPIDEERKTAIQLAHNAVAGKDNPTVLAEMYQRLGLDAKMFSGLTDEVLSYDKISIAGLNAGLQYEQLLVAFLPEDRQAFELALRRVRKSNSIVATHFARFQDFDAVFDAVVAVKEKREVINSALALRVLAELAMERLQQLEAAEPAEAPAS
jgi:hypothetical protein